MSPVYSAGQSANPWQQRKDRVLERINAERKVFINPRKHAKDWQAGLELVGKGLVSFDGATFTAIQGGTNVSGV